ncbi:PAS domain-containing sensor histidine kinase [Arcobacter sp. FWKO B]|uniref:PAS domain-containing sensor histidine kinase n=1 Tax=Arcobacter sp. FWKO B TaxID=2593672 RepID=UPI00190524C5|nr:PAS domain S-box protein [Arcobacter sp. FWKO B]
MENKKIIRLDKILIFVIPFFAIILSIAYFYIKDIEAKNRLYFVHNDLINQLIAIDNSFNEFINHKLELVVFDDIALQVEEFDKKLSFIIEDSKENSFSQYYTKKALDIYKLYDTKRLYIERLKSRKAFAYNTITYFLDKTDIDYLSLTQEQKDSVDDLKIDLIALFFEVGDVKKLDIILNKMEYFDNVNSVYMKNFIRQSHALRENLFQKHHITHLVQNIDLEKNLLSLKQILNTMSDNELTYSSMMINIAFVLMVLFFISILVISFRLQKTRKELASFRTAVENSHNVVVITDKQQKIIYVNEAFEHITGYQAHEVLGNKPNILKSGLQDDDFYKEMAITLENGNKWKGRFINKKKNGQVFYEDATITPVYLDGGVEGYLAIKLDVTQTIEYANRLKELNQSLEEMVNQKVEELTQKDALLQHQSRLAALGEMIGNISHQWRQPLSAITIGASGLKFKKEYGMLQEGDLDESLDNIISSVEYLSNTIDDFRNFFKPEKQKDKFLINDVIYETYKIIENIYVSKGVYIEIDMPDVVEYYGFRGEFSQVIINILNNAKDILLEKKPAIKKVFVRVEQNDKEIVIKIQDNGGGISEDIKDKIFDPYFTTKHQTQGTGIGLYMSFEIVKNHFGGEIYVKNEKIIINDTIFDGASFYIVLPQTICSL